MKTKAFNVLRSYVQPRMGHIVTFVSSAAIVLTFLLGFTQFASAQTFAPITAQASVGARGTNVSSIQTFLASNPALYPEGLVTGYFGSLTQAAVQRFQAFYGIVSSGSPSTTGYGRVGPATLAKMNALIAVGGMGSTGGMVGDVSAPYISNVTVSTTGNSATVSWMTNEPSTDRIYYDTTPIRFNEGDINSSGFLVLSGQAGSASADLMTSHVGTISNLASNTTYYYLIVSKDPSGNVSMSLPGATLRTGQ
jgi:peptidoglycan hydrolase-like protein with peptidoglycan-binding domain